jgi:hypothetical protein
VADIDPPYRLDPLQNVVNVKWDETTAGFQWNFIATFEGSGAFDCQLGPNMGQSTTSFTVTLAEFTPPDGYTVSGSPSGGGTVAGGAGQYAALAFIPASKTGTTPGSATFEVNGLLCGASPSNTIAGAISVFIPAITVTKEADTEGGTETHYEMHSWSASAAAGISVAIDFVEADETE